MDISKDEALEGVDANMESSQKLSYEYSSPDYQYSYDSPLHRSISPEPRSPSPAFSSRSNSPPISPTSPSPPSSPMDMSLPRPVSPDSSPHFSPAPMNISYSSSDSFQSEQSPSNRALSPTLTTGELRMSQTKRPQRRSTSPQMFKLNCLRSPTHFMSHNSPSTYRSPSPRPFSPYGQTSSSPTHASSLPRPLSPSTAMPSMALNSPDHNSRISNSPSANNLTLSVADSPSGWLPNLQESSHSSFSRQTPSPNQISYSLRSHPTIQPHNSFAESGSDINIKLSPAHSPQPTCSMDRNKRMASISPPQGKRRPYYSFSPTFHLSSNSKSPKHLPTYHDLSASSPNNVKGSIEPPQVEVDGQSDNQNLRTTVKTEEVVVDVEQSQPCIVDLTCEDDDDVEIVSTDQPVVFLGTESSSVRRFKKHRRHTSSLQSSCSTATEPIIIGDNIQEAAGDSPSTAINVLDSPITLPVSQSHIDVDLVRVTTPPVPRESGNPQVFGDLLNQSIIPIDNEATESRRSCTCVLNGNSLRQADSCSIHGSSGYRTNDRVLRVDRSRSPIPNVQRSAIEDPIPQDVLEDIASLYAENQRCHRTFSILKRNLLSGHDGNLRLLSEASTVRLQALCPRNHHSQASQASASSSSEDSGGLSCPICFESFQEIKKEGKSLSSTVCGHIFCTNCLEAAFKQVKQCPTCRKRLNKKQYHPLYI